VSIRKDDDVTSSSLILFWRERNFISAKNVISSISFCRRLPTEEKTATFHLQEI